ncbi:MAG: DUF3786 domain-containing protein [Deltaproteobacteria bacterium]|nr:DUF3786 domain-containing protein [Deltaproteobacteria bacterium]
MTKKSTREEAIELALASAQQRLRGLHPATVAQRAGVEWHEGQGGGGFEIAFLNRRYRVELPGVEVRGEAGEEPSLVRRVLILHYLIQAQGKELARRWVDFRSLPGGVAYYPVFRGRVIARLVRMFGERPQALISAAVPLGGRAIAMADWAVEIPVFARVPVVFALWEASEEFAPEGTIMYDDALPAYLETEDAIIVCEEILGALKGNVQKV